MSRVCVEAQKGRLDPATGIVACVCKRYVDADTALRLYRVVHRGHPLLDPRHPDHAQNRDLRTYEDLCSEAGAPSFRVGSTRVTRKTRTTTGNIEGEGNMADYESDYGDLPPIEDYGDFGQGVLAKAKAMVPSTREIMNMVKAGGGVVGALLISDQVIPRVPWLKDQNVYVKAGVKVLGAIVAGKLLSRVDGFLGGGMSAGFLASAVYDVLDTLIFKGGSAQAAVAPQLPATTEEKKAGAGYGISPDEQLFDVEQRLFADVDVMQPDEELAGEATSDVDIMQQGGPMYIPPDGSEGEMEGVGSFLS